MGTLSGFLVGAIVGAAVVVVFFWKPWEVHIGWWPFEAQAKSGIPLSVQ